MLENSPLADLMISGDGEVFACFNWTNLNANLHSMVEIPAHKALHM